MSKYKQREFNTKIQYEMDKKKHDRLIAIFREKGNSFAVFARQKIDRLEKTNSHINVTYEQKKILLKHLEKEGLGISEWVDKLADEIINNYYKNKEQN